MKAEIVEKFVITSSVGLSGDAYIQCKVTTEDAPGSSHTAHSMGALMFFYLVFQ